MKTARFHSLKVRSAVTGIWLFAAFGCMAGPAAGLNGNAAVGSSSGAAAGGHAAVVSSGGGHAVSSTATHASGVSHPGMVGGAGSANNTLRPITATYSGPPRYLPGGFAPTVSNRASVSNVVAGRASMPPNASAPNVPASRVAPSVPTDRARNAWTDPSSAQTAGGFRRGNNLLGAAGSASANHDSFSNRNGADHGASDHRFDHRRGFPFVRRWGYYGGYGNGYPYGVYGGYSPYIYGDTASATADAPGDDSNSTPSVNGAPFGGAGSVAMTPQPADSGADALPPDNATGGPTQAPPTRNLQSNTGPDSLVEAVQAELSRRGYFGGQIDAVYNAATHAAIERFQSDQRLPATGRINEATLHALELD